MFLKNASVLFGPELKFIQSTNLQTANQVFQKIGSNIKTKNNEKILDCEGLLIIPGFVNAHTHVGDSIAKDISVDSSANSKINPVLGKKRKILKNSDPAHLTNFMKLSCQSMLKKGITTFVDFREGGIEGIGQLKNAISNLPIRSVILGRLNYYQKSNQIKKNKDLPQKYQEELSLLLRHCDGLGISGPNENSNCVLAHYSKTKKIRAIHSAETLQSNNRSKKLSGLSETQRALLLKPHFLIHMTYASKRDLVQVAKKTKGIVICPRANAALAEGIPDIDLMMKANCNVALGTDNVMVNSPDIFREMDYLWKVSMGLHRKRLPSRDILKMATVNGGKILGNKTGIIAENALADCILFDKHSIDLEPMHDPHTAIVQRASETSIQAVMVGGAIVHGKI